ncbi:MAG: sulfite exporter TauE/SafE family protein [Magnetospirillum sp.]|nr:MAG: sulfite exporter TauE/SafE family protein [Magnetospirillum sp.]
MVAVLAAACLLLPPAMAAETGLAAVAPGGLPWWAWPIILFGITFLLGVVAVLGGVGGGVLFVPIIGSFFPFHLDFVRGAGLLIALAGSLAAGPSLLRNGLANLRLALPLGLIASISAIMGAMMGLALPVNVVQTALGITILAIVALMWAAKKSDVPNVDKPDRLGQALQMHGIFHDPAAGRDIDWHVHRTPVGMVLFFGIGMMAGMFGLGAGWANVPVLNLVMGVPLRVSAATSSFLLSIVDTAAAWVYLNKGAVLTMIAAPSIIGMMLGSMVGAKLLTRAKTSLIRKIILTMLLLAGSRALLKGLGIWA